MPRPCDEGMVEVRDEMKLGKIKLNLTKNFRQEESPKLQRRKRLGCYFFFGSLS